MNTQYNEIIIGFYISHNLKLFECLKFFVLKRFGGKSLDGFYFQPVAPNLFTFLNNNPERMHSGGL
jgi:hypothetical protein